MNKRILYVIYVNSGLVGACLDFLRILASPDAKRYSHVTVRGPYEVSLDRNELKALNTHIVSNSIYLDGTGNFFGEGQNTVFFSCSGPYLRKIWHKPEFRDFNPHVTVYDGEDVEFARSLFEVISSYSYKVRCGAGSLEDADFFLRCATRGLTKHWMESIRKMRTQERLQYVEAICKFLASDKLTLGT